LIVFFVVDRPASLRILEPLTKEYLMGFMSHPNTSKNFQEMFSKFDNVVKMCDCGAWTKEGAPRDYEKLFSIYERMKVDYGLIIDYLWDYEKTLESAKKAMEVYSTGSYKFKLVGVAQGKSKQEYLKCLNKLIKLDFEHIAVGGLLTKVPNTARYVRVRNEQFMWDILSAIRREYDGWLFALGCYHPKRHKRFEQLNLFGSDYKGWIFRYKNTESRFEEVREWIRRNIYGKVSSNLSLFG